MSKLGRRLILHREENEKNRKVTQEQMEASKKEIEVVAGQLDDLVKDMDKKLNRVLKRQEQDYLKGYSIYVREKERELRELVIKINERNQ